MRNFFKLLGVIALAAVIGFSMIACGGDDDGDSITIALEKVSDTSFTLTLTGAVWRPVVTGSNIYRVALYDEVFGGMPRINGFVSNAVAEADISVLFDMSIQENPNVLVWRARLQDPQLSGTITLNEGVSNFNAADLIAQYGDKEPYLKIESGKNSITF